MLTGRIKDVNIRKGENVSAKEVEDVLYTHPGIAEVTVIGLPDPQRGERVRAAVHLAPGTPQLTLDDVVALSKAHGLMTQKIPERLEARAELPRGSIGKVLKKALPGEYSDAPAGQR